MLVVTRKLDEGVVILDEIIVTVVEIKGDKVRLGISAPKDIQVDRTEVYERKTGKKVESPFATKNSKR